MSATKQPEPPTIYVYDRREAIWRSVCRDAVSFGMLIGTAWVLNTQMEPSAWLNAALGISWFLWLLGKSSIARKQMTPAETIAWIKREYPEEQETN